jgi:hypothetical protein
MLLPASDLTEILANLAALNLQPNTAAAVLGAVLAPLLRTTETPPAGLEPQPSRQPRSSKRARGARRKRKYKRHAPSEARDRALAALQANPEAFVTDIAKIAKVSRSTVVNAREDLAAAARRKPGPKPAASRDPLAKSERRERAERFLREQLARGPKQVSEVEEAAARAHLDVHVLEQARADLGVVTSRGNAGGVQAVQWALPGRARGTSPAHPLDRIDGSLSLYVDQ